MMLKWLKFYKINDTSGGFKLIRISLTLFFSLIFVPNLGLAQKDKKEIKNSDDDAIIVTAQRREEKLSKSASAISAIRGKDLEQSGIKTMSDLSTVAPTLQISGNGPIIAIRGISSSDLTEKGNSAVAVTLDGINMGRPLSQRATFVDLDRIEVLRGPQGTYYGGGAAIGAINIITNKPKEKFASNLTLDVGNYNAKNFSAMVNTPISDALLLRVAVASFNHDGYIPSVNGKSFSDQKEMLARAHVLFKATDDLKILLSFYFNKEKGVGPGRQAISPFLNSSGIGYVDVHPADAPAPYPSIDRDNKGIHAEITQNFDWSTLTALFAKRWFKRLDAPADIGGLPTTATGVATGVRDVGYRGYIFHSVSSQDSLELRLNSKAGEDLQWVGGLYSFYERTGLIFRLNNMFGSAAKVNNSFLEFNTLYLKHTNKAAFANLRYKFLEDLTLGVGARSTQYIKASRQFIGVFTDTGKPASYTPFKADLDEKKVTWQVEGEYHLSKDIMSYAKVSTGYKPGGFNDGSPETNADFFYRSENVTMTELGFKAQLLDKDLQWNSTLFSGDYKDKQLSIVRGNGQQTFNAGQAKIQGWENETIYKATPSDTFNLGLTLLSAKYVEFMAKGTGKVNDQDWSGKDLDLAPKSVISIAYNHKWFLDGDAALIGRISTMRSSGYKIAVYGGDAYSDPALQLTQKAYTISNLGLTYEQGKDWWVQAYANNLENRITFTAYNSSGLDVTDPRVFGIRGGYTF